EHGLAADGRHSDRVSVRADPGHRTLELPAGVAEAQTVEDRDRARAHGNDVPEDPADSGRRALEGLDRRGLVVGLDLERHRLALAEIDHAGVLTWALQNAFPLGGEPFQQE